MLRLSGVLAWGLPFLLLTPAYGTKRPGCGPPMERVAAHPLPRADAALEAALLSELARSPTATRLEELITAFVAAKSNTKSTHWSYEKIDELEDKFLSAFEGLHGKHASLDDKYGKLHLPAMAKEWEMSESGIVRNPTLQILDPNLKDQKVGKLDETKEYSWIIDDRGRLLVGEEYLLRKDASLGHPTLLNGQFGRIAGDLKFERGEWRITQKSARYSMLRGHKRANLENVGKLFEEFGKKVEVDWQAHLDF